MLIDNYDFYYYILRTLLQILQNIRLLTEYDLRKYKEQYMKIYFKIDKQVFYANLTDIFYYQMFR